MNSSLNIVLFGETGVGKSSVVNLIAGRQIAKVSLCTTGCTMEFKPHAFPVGGRDVHIWDTNGLDEPEIDANGYLLVIERACELIRQLSNSGGIDMLLFCIRGGRVTATMQSNYRLFHEILCKSQVPIALVVTHLEREVVLEDWWEREAGNLAKYGIKAVGHACVTGILEHSKFEESQQNIARLLGGQNGIGRYNIPRETWFIEFLHLFWEFTPLTKNLIRKDIVKVLTGRCGLDTKIAVEVMDKLQNPQAHSFIADRLIFRKVMPLFGGIQRENGAAETMNTPTQQPDTINVVLFGEAGVGKSSVVNLIAGEKRANVSSGVDSCTMESTPYGITFDDTKFTVFDTMGLNEPGQGVKGYLTAIEKAYKLISQLSAAGGIHLLLFCMRGSRLTETTLNNYRLFHEFLCDKKVPIVLVITCLEQEEEMENWWVREGSNVERLGLKCNDHTCVTTIQDGKPDSEQNRKYTESQSKIRALLKRFARETMGYLPEKHAWFARVAQKMMSFVKKHNAMLKRKDLLKALTSCNLDLPTAERIVKMIEEDA